MVRRLIIAVLAAGLAAPLYVTPPASAAVLFSCTTGSGSLSLSPGLGSTAVYQTNVSFSLSVSGCSNGDTASANAGSAFGWSTINSGPGAPNKTLSCSSNYPNNTPIMAGFTDPSFGVTWALGGSSTGITKVKASGVLNTYKLVLVITSGKYVAAGQKTKLKGSFTATPASGSCTNANPTQSLSLDNSSDLIVQGILPPASSTKNGVFAGCCDQAKVNAFGTWLGRTPDLAVDFPPGGSWQQIENPAPWVNPWIGSPWQMSFSIPMLVPGAKLSIGATGAYNAHFVTLAQNLVDRGFGNAILRVGWEFNGNWYPWRAKPNKEAFKQYWKKIVKSMRSVSGANFKFDWSHIIGKYEFPAAEAYPGDAFVDYIGVDIYDKSAVYYPIPAGATAQEAQNRRQAVWNEFLNGREGLTYWAQFAKDHGKRISLPEWGLMTPPYNGGGDNVYFIEQLHNWIQTHDVAYHSYFNNTGGLGDHRLTGATAFPAAAARYRALFGSG